MRGPTDPAARARPVRRAAAAALALALTAALGGCGLGGGGTASLGPTTTVAAVQAHLVIEPAAGPIGTVFTLSADGMVPGAAVQFEITFPGDGRAYPGSALVVADDGTVSATYRATSANQPGTYLVRLTGPQGQLAAGQFQVTDGKPLPSGTPTKGGTGGASSTSVHPGSSRPSTTRPGATTTTPPTTARPTTSVVRPGPTTVPPTTRPTVPPTTAPPTSA